MDRLRERSRLVAVVLAALTLANACTAATPSTSPASSPALATTSGPTLATTAAATSQPTPTHTAAPSLEPLPSLELPDGWKSVEVPGVEADPLLAHYGDRLYLAGMDALRNTVLFTSEDGLAWKQVAAEGIENDFVPRAMIEDQRGGLLLVGELTTADEVVPEIWRSLDKGATFAGTPIDTPSNGAGEIVGVDMADAEVVAFGGHHVMSLDKSVGEQQGLDVWRSMDGVNWTHQALPGSDGYDARSVTHWSGGVAVLGTDSGHQKRAVWVWTSQTGWKKTVELSNVSTGPILGFKERLILLGYDEVRNVGPVPTAWWSSDARAWNRAVVPVKGIGVMFDGGFVTEDRIVAYGMSHVATGGGPATPSPVPGASASFAPPTAAPSFDLAGPTFWVSDSSGLTWRQAGSAPFYMPYHASISTIGGHIVFATAGLHRAIVSVGDIP